MHHQVSHQCLSNKFSRSKYSPGQSIAVLVSRALFNNGQKVIHETLLMCTLFWQTLVVSSAPFGPRSRIQDIEW